MLAGCAAKGPVKANSNGGEADLPALGVSSGPLTVSAQNERGQRLWVIEAARGDASLDSENSRAQLEGVKATLMQDGERYLEISSESGWAEESTKTFGLVGGVHAASADGRVEISGNRLEGTSETSKIAVFGDVRAVVNGMGIGPASVVTASFKVNEQATSLKLVALRIQGSNVWFESPDKNFTISGVREGESTFGDDGRSVRISLSGSPVKMNWKSNGLTIIANEVEATLDGRQTEGYRLMAGEFRSGVRVEVSGATGGKSWVATGSSQRASYDGEQARLTLSSGVSISSTQPEVRGNVITPTAFLDFNRERIGAGKYELEALEARGEGTKYSDGDISLVGLSWARIAKSSESNLLEFSGEGRPFTLTYQPAGDTASRIALSGHKAEGKFLRVATEGQTRLSSLRMSNGVAASLSGVLPEGKRPWSLEGECSELTYSGSEAKMVLVDVRKVTGRHPTLPTGEGTLFAPRIEIGFFPGTFDVRRIRTTGAGG